MISDAITRRSHLAQLAGFGATMFGAGASAARSACGMCLLKGIGKSIRHISWSDAGGHPDGVQIMLNRNHLYLGHQFTDGFSVLDASDPRNLRPAKYILTAPNTSTHHLQVANDILLVAEGANVMAMQSYDDAPLLFRKYARRFDHKEGAVPRRAFGLGHQDGSREPARDRLPSDAGLRDQPAVVDRRALRLCRGAFRRLHRPYSRHRGCQQHHEAAAGLERPGCPE